MMSLARWFRELRGKSSKDADFKQPVKGRDEHRVKLSRTNSALPSNCKHSDFVDSPEDVGRSVKYEKKLKHLDKRRYSFNGGSSSKVSRSLRTCIPDDPRLLNRQNTNGVADRSQTSRSSLSGDKEISSSSYQKDQQQAMLGSEFPKKTRSSLDHKHAVRHQASALKLLCTGYQKYEDTRLSPVKFKTVVGKCKKSNIVDVREPKKPLDEEARSREKIYMPHVECERIFTDDEDDDPPRPADRGVSLLRSATHRASGIYHLHQHSHQDSSYMSQDGDYAECYVEEGRTLLTKAELEQYTKDYEENIINNSHQKQHSYAQSEGYHSYVSSNDSAIITPFLDRLRRENDVIVSVEENIVADRKSNASSGSSSDTLKWHGSLSDVSVTSGSYRSMTGSNSSICNLQHNIVHSARVQTPQRHHSESVLYLGSAILQTPSAQQWQDKVQNNNQLNSQLRKLFPVNTYSVYPQQAVCSNSNGLPELSPVSPKLSVAERIIELERQQLNQGLQNVSARYTYLDPDKKHKVSDQNLKVIQKKALLSYYERNHFSWRSEPQLSPVPSPPQPPKSRPRLPTPTSRRSSSASDYQDSLAKENRPLPKEQEGCNSNDVINRISSNFDYQNETRVFSQYSGRSLASGKIGSMIIGDPISVDDWVPELPPKKAHLRAAHNLRRLPSPDLPPPSPPPFVDDEVFISDVPLPPPPPEILSDSVFKSKETVSSPTTAHSLSAVPDLISLSANMMTLDEDECKGTGLCNRADLRRSMRNITNDQKKMNIIAEQLSATRLSNSKLKDNEFLRYSRHLYKEKVSTAECRNQDEAEHHRIKESFVRASSTVNEVVKCQNTAFLAKRSVFSNGYPEHKSLRYSSTPNLQINGKLSHVANTGVTHVNHKSNIINPSSSTEFKKINPTKDSQFSSVVLRHSEKFPAKLDPQCPPTTYQLSQSSYRGDPRVREKGLPNFEGSYKRTMSPSSSLTCTAFKNGHLNGTNHCAKDVENVNPQLRTVTTSNSISLYNCKYETTRSHHVSNYGIPSAASETAILLPSQPTCHHDEEKHAFAPEKYPLLECSTPMCHDYTYNSLPKNSVSIGVSESIVPAATVPENIEPKLRNSRAPRTQSDPSSVKETSVSLLCSQTSSVSALSLQKTGGGGSESSLSVISIPRSHSDLSNVGSIESGYSSLSLNILSPSVSPTRLCAPTTSTATERTTSTATSTISWSCTAVQCDIANVMAMSDGQVGSSPTAGCQRTANRDGGNDDDDSAKYPLKSEIVLRISVTSSDAASQTDTFVTAVVARAEPATGVVDDEWKEEEEENDTYHSPDCCGSSLILKQKSQEEIDCEQLSSDLVSHLSCNDHLYRVLSPGKRVKKSTDYLANVFRPNLIFPCSEYSCSSLVTKQPEDTRLQEGSIVKEKFISYQSETTNTYRTKQTEICDIPHDVQTTSHYRLQQIKEKLSNRLDHRLNLLRSEQTAVAEECRLNDSLGEIISQKVTKCLSPQEAAKYKLHIQEIGHITSLLLGLSGRLAKVENLLQELTDDDCLFEKKNLEAKRDKLLYQLEEAKELKTNIDKRSSAMSAILVKYFTNEEVAEYEYFVHTKSKLLIDCRDISEKIEHVERQLTALREAKEGENF